MMALLYYRVLLHSIQLLKSRAPSQQEEGRVSQIAQQFWKPYPLILEERSRKIVRQFVEPLALFSLDKVQFEGWLLSDNNLTSQLPLATEK
jgi:hypothetical protein